MINKKIENIAENGYPVVVIGHSLGGVLALCVANHKNVDMIITISAPYSGVHVPLYMKLYIVSPIIKSIFEESAFIQMIQTTHYKKPIYTLVSMTGFNPGIHGKSDGVISIRSQTVWTPHGAEVFRINENHHDILQSVDTYRIIKEKMQLTF